MIWRARCSSAALEQGAEQKPRNVMITRAAAQIPDERAEEFTQPLRSEAAAGVNLPGEVTAP